MTTNLDKFDVFPWNENFETGITKIDDQHRVLVSLLNKLANCLVDTNSTEINAAINELSNYAEMHFDEEEAIWSEMFTDDSWLSSHQMSHASFLPAIIKIKEQSSRATLSETTEQIVKYLIRWLAFHIIDNDKRMAIAVKAMESGCSFEEAKIKADKKMAGSMRILIETILKMYDGVSNRTIELMRERNARKNAEQKLKKANRELQIALEEIKTLQGIIPICSYCHEIRNDEGAWEQMEAYITYHSEATFSHSICPKCLPKVKKEIKDMKNKKD